MGTRPRDATSSAVRLQGAQAGPEGAGEGPGAARSQLAPSAHHLGVPRGSATSGWVPGGSPPWSGRWAQAAPSPLHAGSPAAKAQRARTSPGEIREAARMHLERFGMRLGPLGSGPPRPPRRPDTVGGNRRPPHTQAIRMAWYIRYESGRCSDQCRRSLRGPASLTSWSRRHHSREDPVAFLSESAEHVVSVRGAARIEAQKKRGLAYARWRRMLTHSTSATS